MGDQQDFKMRMLRGGGLRMKSQLYIIIIIISAFLKCLFLGIQSAS